MNKKNITILVGVILIAGAFFSGYYFGKNNPTKAFNGNISRTGGMGLNVNGRNFTQGARMGSGFVVGQVLSKDKNSLTVKLRDGGSKIVFYLSSTTVTKMDSGSMNDIIVGSEVSVTGNANSDGSVNAQSIQEIKTRVNN